LALSTDGSKKASEMLDEGDIKKLIAAVLHSELYLEAFPKVLAGYVLITDSHKKFDVVNGKITVFVTIERTIWDLERREELVMQNEFRVLVEDYSTVDEYQMHKKFFILGCLWPEAAEICINLNAWCNQFLHLVCAEIHWKITQRAKDVYIRLRQGATRAFTKCVDLSHPRLRASWIAPAKSDTNFKAVLRLILFFTNAVNSSPFSSIGRWFS
jgi:hypothetical protein